MPAIRRRLAACVATLVAVLSASVRAPTQTAGDPLAAARTTLASAHATLLAKLDAAKTHSDDAYDIVFRLNAASAALDSARAAAEPGYVRERELAARLDAAWIEAVTSGACAPPSGAGASETCFRATGDGTLQPLALYMPADAPQRPAAVVVLRGRGQTESDFLARRELRELADGSHAILIAPYARGRATYDRIATQDVFDALDAVERAHPLDRDRVYIAGYSMGGAAAFHLAGTAPKRFAAVLSIVGALDAGDRDAMRAFAPRPAYVVNGENDAVIPPANGRSAHRYLRSLGVLSRYYEQPHGGHDLRSMFPAVGAAWHDMFAGVTSLPGDGEAVPLPAATHSGTVHPS